MKKQTGLGLRHSFHQLVLDEKPKIPWFEVITENYLFFDGKPRDFLQKIRTDYPVAFHGVSLSIGSMAPLRMDYLKRLKTLINEFEPLWVSDHLCWTFLGNENSHDLLPLIYTQKSLSRIADRVSQAQDILGRKLFLENLSAYVDFKENEMSEADFIKDLIEKSGCGLLLDLNNLVVNHHNLNYNPLHYLEKIKSVEVLQIHLAGHTIKDNVRIDTHDHDVSQEVLDLLPHALQFWPQANPMIEWDDKIPPFEYLNNQRQQIQNLIDSLSLQNHPEPNLELTPTLKDNFSKNDEDSQHQKFWKLLKSNDYVTSDEVSASKLFSELLPTPAVVGMNVYSSAYYNRLVDVLSKDFPCTFTALNDFFDDVALAYLQKNPSTNSSIDFIGRNFSNFIRDLEVEEDYGVDTRILADLALFENSIGEISVVFSDSSSNLNFQNFTENDWLTKKLFVLPSATAVPFESEIHNAYEALKSQNTPEIPDLQPTYYLFYRLQNVVHYRQLDEFEYQFFQFFKTPKLFSELEFAEIETLQASMKILFEFDFLFSEATD